MRGSGRRADGRTRAGPLTSTRSERQTVAADHFAEGPVGAAMAQLLGCSDRHDGPGRTRLIAAKRAHQLDVQAGQPEGSACTGPLSLVRPRVAGRREGNDRQAGIYRSRNATAVRGGNARASRSSSRVMAANVEWSVIRSPYRAQASRTSELSFGCTTT